MARYRTRRQNRYTKLRMAGFLPFEAHELSRVPFKVPYMRGLVRGRFKRLDEALESGVKRAQWDRQIKTEYIDKGWTKIGKKLKPVYDVWSMMRDFERDYRVRHPEYQSPWEKKRRSFTDFMGKIEQAYNTFPQSYRMRNRAAELERGDYNQRIIRAIAEGDQKTRRELEKERNKRFGY